MKAKYALIALLAITFYGCDDNTAGLGLGMFPGSDQNLNGKLSSFDVTTESVKTGKIYAKTNIGYVGKFTDNIFGTYNAGFLATLNCPAGLTFPGLYDGSTLDSDGKVTKTMVAEAADDIELIYDKDNGADKKVIGNIHTVELYLLYRQYFGDSLTACRLSVYELDKKLEIKDNPYYTDIDPEGYYDAQKPEALLGTKAYTAVDASLSYAERQKDSYTPNVHLNLSKEISLRVGKAILRASRAAGSNFDNAKFSEAFKGLYVKSDYGDGTVLYVDQVQMNVVYKRYAANDTTGVIIKKKVAEEDGSFADSTYYQYRPFVSTREVIQANRLTNDEVAIENCIKQTDCTYLKSPAGIFTQATLPIQEIKEKLDGDTLNAVKLSFANYNQASDKKFGMSIPADVLLIRKKLKDSFFENNQLADDISSYLPSQTNTNNQYVFGNITKLINACIEDEKFALNEFSNNRTIEVIWAHDGITEKVTVNNIADWKEKSGWDQVVLIPVLATKEKSSNGYDNKPRVISIQHDLKPSYVKLKGGTNEDPKYRLKLEVLSTNFAGTVHYIV